MYKQQDEQSIISVFTFGAVCVLFGFIGSCLISLWALAAFALTVFGMLCLMPALLVFANPPLCKKDKNLRMNEKYYYSKQKGKNKKFKNGRMKF